MDSKELMIGDFVIYTDKDGIADAYKVVGVTDQQEVFLEDPKAPEDGSFDVWDDMMERVNPMKISEKFLLKNGFVSGVDVSGVHEVYVYHGDKDEFGMSQNIVRVNFYEELGILVRAERTCIDSKIGLHVKSAHRPNSQFVHQLQQVCRLCGIEIDWKL